VIGALAGGGKGAAIGAAVGAGAGTAGAAFTGNKNIVLPAESAVSFNLLKPVEVAAK
jgi:outer membrane lipoprotein SlyB